MLCAYVYALLMAYVLSIFYLVPGPTPATAAYDAALRDSLWLLHPTTFNGTLPAYATGDVVSGGGARARVERR